MLNCPDHVRVVVLHGGQRRLFVEIHNLEWVKVLIRAFEVLAIERFAVSGSADVVRFHEWVDEYE
jgi:hypothetical protein